jgi:enoyl-CoA hydratase
MRSRALCASSWFKQCMSWRGADRLVSLPFEGLQAYKRLIDDGYAVSLREGLAIETERSTAYNSKVAPESIAERRDRVRQHGKCQTERGK